MSAIGGKADVRELPAVCPLIARSGHSRLEFGMRRIDRPQGPRQAALVVVAAMKMITCNGLLVDP